MLRYLTIIDKYDILPLPKVLLQTEGLQMNTEQLIERERQKTEKAWDTLLKKHIISPGVKCKVEVKVTFTKQPITAVTVEIPPELLGDHFGRKGHRYFSRQLTKEEIEQITQLPWKGWKKVFVTTFMKHKNPALKETALENAARQAGRRGQIWPFAICNVINQDLAKKFGLPYRLHSDRERSLGDETREYRFYRKVNELTL